MANSRNFALLWLCVALALAISLGFVCITILTNVISTDFYTTGQVRFGTGFWVAAVLLSGTTLSFLLVLSQFFWRKFERRSTSLQALNDALNYHLDQERALRFTNERIFEFSRDILCSISADGTFRQISPACKEILGYTSEELLGQHYERVVAQEDRASTEERVRLLVAGELEKSSGFRNNLCHRNGHLVTISWTAEWSPEDKTLFCVGRNISDQLTAETLTRERDQFFSLSPDMFCIVDLNSHFFEINNTFVETLGYSREKLIGTSYLRLVHPDDQLAAIDAVRSLTEGNAVSELQIRVRSNDGNDVWLNINAILSADGLIYVVARDTTEQRQFEQKLRENEALLKMAERVAMLGGWVLDLETDQSTWSDAVCTIHDMPLGQAPDLKHALSFYLPEDRERLANAVDVCSEKGIPFDEELQIKTAKGRLRWIRTIGHPVKDKNGKIVRLQGALQDITASRKTMEELERSNRELQDFAFVASHDLQEPLRKIQAFSDRLISHSEDFGEKEKDYLQRMQSAAERMQHLIEDLLSYSRTTTSTNHMVPCDIGTIFEIVLQDMETSIDLEKAQIEVGELLTTCGDATQLRQVLQNLLSNAIKFHAEDRRPEIKVYSEEITEEEWTLVISDNGIGFDERLVEKVFQPFQRLHQKYGYAGTGIGLAIVKKILNRHGASISVSSIPGEGTTFRIRLKRS